MPQYKDKKTGKWYYQINYTDIDGEYKQKRRSGFTTKAEAKDAEYLEQLDHSTKSNITFDELYQKYFSHIEGKVRYSSWYSKKNLGDIHILPFFLGKKSDKVTSKDIVEWEAWMREKNFSYNYLSKIYNNLSAIFKFGMLIGLKENPCKKVGNFENVDRESEKVNFWTHDEFKQFIATFSQQDRNNDIEYYTFFLFQYYMGTRKGEARALSWKDINMKTGIVNINKSMPEKTKKGQDLKPGPTKNPQSVRKISMPKLLIDQMKVYHDWCKEHEGFNDKCFVFGMFRSMPTTNIDRYFQKYIKISGVKRIKVHDLRHSHASLLINNGATILAVSKRLGHKDITETLNTYSHMFPEKEKEVIDIIDNLS